jgi:putative transposase
VCAAFGGMLTSVKTMMREALRPAQMVQGFVQDLLRSPQELIAENVALRQQLIVAARKVKRPNFGPLDRGLLVALASILPRWRDALLLVKPETVLRWHRQGFRLL